MALRFEDFSDQYRVFSEFPELSDESIDQFLSVVQELKQAPNAVRGERIWNLQANVGMWQILARQGRFRTRI